MTIYAKEQNWCASETALEITARDRAVFEMPPFAALVQRLGAGLVADRCPSMQTLRLTGVVAGAQVWQGSADVRSNWALSAAADPSKARVLDLDAGGGAPVARPPPATGATPPPVAVSSRDPYAAPPLDAQTLAFAYSKLSGITPDFRPYAEQTVVFRNASAFDRDAVRTREMARLAKQFEALDLNQTYTMHINSNIGRYDAGQNGFPLSMRHDSFVRITDPVAQTAYLLSFTNIDAFDVIPAADPAAARTFAETHGLNSHDEIASANDRFDVALKITAAPATPGGYETPVQAVIPAARVFDRGGRLLHDFGQNTDAAAIMPQIGLPTLKASDVSGIKLGMPAADAIKSATAQFQVARVMSNYATFFNGIDKDRADRVSCIEIENPFIGVAGVEGFDSCLALQMSNGAVTNILSVQHLKGGNPEVIRAALRDKYGEGASSGAGRLSWVGIDAAAAVGAKIEIVSNLTTSSVGDRLVLSIRPYAPAAKPAEQPATPKL